MSVVARWRERLRPSLIGAASLFDISGQVTYRAMRDALPPADDWQAVGGYFEEAGRLIGDVMGRGGFACPCCGAVSHHPNDIEQHYCSRCHWWTGDSLLGPPHLEAPCAAREAGKTTTEPKGD